MSQDQEQAVKMRGYQLWQESGYAHGHDREHWDQAEQDVKAAEQAAQGLGAKRGEERRQGDGSSPFDTPMALFYAVAQGWLEFGRVLAGMATRSPWGVQVR